MKALLILVGQPDFRAEYAAGRPLPVMSPPMTLLVLGEVCRRAGFEAELIDTRLLMEPRGGGWALREGALGAAIEGSSAEVAGLSFLSSSAAEGFRVAGLCRAAGKTVIGGGLHAAVAPQEFIGSGAFHYVVQGEGEAALPRLLEELRDGRRARHPETAEVLRAEPLRDLSAVPPVTDFSVYAPVFEQYRDSAVRSAYVETTRGCFKSCTFCEVAKTGAAWSRLRRVPLETNLQTIEHAVTRHAVNYVLVADSIATTYKPHFLGLVSAVAERYPEVALHFNSTVDFWDEERARACRAVRCSAWFGFESGSQRVLDEVLLKGTTVEQAYAAARLCRENEIPCAFNVLLGLPGETEEDYLRTFEVFERCPWVYPNPNIFNPLPGTALYEQCLLSGALRDPRDYSVWDAERVAGGEGPVRGVDYGLVLKYHRLLTQLQSDPARSLTR
jgi:anaerobic magnesium-protoporphyrin IX monomethyl ester cyclase